MEKNVLFTIILVYKIGKWVSLKGVLRNRMFDVTNSKIDFLPYTRGSQTGVRRPLGVPEKVLGGLRYNEKKNKTFAAPVKNI